LPWLIPPDDLTLNGIAGTYWGPCGLTVKGEIKCWGTQREDVWPYSFEVPAGRRFSSLRGAANQLCAADEDGLWCDSREADDSGFESPPDGKPTDYCMNVGYGCGIFDDGVECWGEGGDDPWWGRFPDTYVPDNYRRRAKK